MSTPEPEPGSSRGVPPAEVDITPTLVRRLLETQHPDLAREPLRAIGAGWDNAIFRLGTKLAVRLPRRAAAAPLCLHERRWLPTLAGSLPVPIPAPVRSGAPGCGFPWHWSVLPWIEGSPADLSPLRADEGAPLASFLNALHVAAPADAPLNPYRGVSLLSRRAVTEERMRRVAAQTALVTPRVRELWAQALEAPLDTPPTWLHGDLHAQNVLVVAGALSGVIDWGDLCRGDRATDLAAIWLLLASADARTAAMRSCSAVTEATWTRARGWAIAFGVVFLDSGLNGDPRFAAMGERALRHVAE
jgi:aminoglycoside phosphotransferase (APT) family kinase protein